MKKIFVLFFVATFSLHLLSQVTGTARTPVKSICLQKEIIPPYLSVVDNSIIFSDGDGNNIINAQETCSIAVTIRNEGKGNAYGCVAKISGEGNIDGLTFTDCTLPTIKAGESYTLNIPIKASMYTTSGQVRFKIQVDEPNGFGTDPVLLTIGTHKFDAPMIEIVSYKISSDGSSQLRKKRPFKLQVLLQNTDQGEAKNVTCSFSIPENMFLLDGSRYQTFPSLLPNEQKLLEFELQSNANVKDNLNIEFKLSESYGKYANDASIPLHFGQEISSGMIDIQVAGKNREEVRITKGTLISDVDRDIPVTTEKNPNTFVLIIANEHYQQVAAVPYALNDGRILAKYCQRTLGIPASNIKVHENATYNDIRLAIEWLKNVCEKYEGEASVIFYYAGHGIPDPADKSAYLLPVDGDGRYVATGYKLDELYKKLGEMPSKSMTILLDACFSGANRDGKMLASERGVALKSKSGVPQGNMVVFSAAQEDETALPYEEEGHGMFTYYILKKLQETEGNITLQELSQYVIREVGRKSAVTNKPQTPCVTPSAEVGTEWKTWTLK